MNFDAFDIIAAIWAASFIVCLTFALEILRSQRPEQSIAAWLLLFLFMAPLGVALYLLLGRRKIRLRSERKPPPPLANLGSHDTAPISLFDVLIRSYGLPPAAEANKVTFHGTGASAYAAILDLIEAAETSLWLSTYILSDDSIGREIIRRLSARAKAGVQVRLLVDYIGSPDARDGRLSAPLEAAGGAVLRFMPVTLFPRSQHYSNLRNHRKMVLADQRRVWSGGMNLSELYLGSPSRQGFFHDLSFVIDGPAAAVYARIFAGDWAFCAEEDLAIAQSNFRTARAAGAGVVQVVPAGPEFRGDAVYDVILTMVHRAERRLWVVSPYFVPDVGLIRAFVLAARRGVDVRFLTDFASDVALLDFASVSYLRALASAGGRVLRFKDGLIHAKALVVDDDLALAGTTNLDQRSLFLNFEVMTLFYGRQETVIIADWMQSFFARCTEELPPVTPTRQVAEGIIRLFAPVL